MTVTGTIPADPAFAVLYQHIQQFYAQQMQLLDDGEAERWAETFTEDGVFDGNAFAEPAVGRSVIAAAARRAVDDYTARGIQRRHWLGMLWVQPQQSDEVLVTCYAQVLETPRGRRPELRASTGCRDLLVRGERGWLVKHRHIHRDDLD
ncbi:nuclear transport factor 2 family protein [Streptomyces sp. NPDC001351]|uniref:nuclear transport factor 2 family protein n=1 Tax=Streptomyces sp. NPDC001351 TaxID=3364564 RepID=UPI0036C36D76